MSHPPRNVEQTKVHHQCGGVRAANDTDIPTVSREVFQNDFNRNVVIRREFFGRRWVLTINEGQGDDESKTKLRVVAYVLVFFSLLVAVCLGIFFSIYRNRLKASEDKIVDLKPITNITQTNNTYVNRTQGNQVAQKTTEITTEKIKTTTKTTTTDSINKTSLIKSVCGPCVTNEEVCLKNHDTDVPKCRRILNKKDPTGCGGICPINTHFCQILDAKAKVYQCSLVKKALICPHNSFNCGNMCISKENRCDGLLHCSNASDEKNCVCDLNTHFHCGNSTSCLEKWKRCDQKVDCWDKSDEADCMEGVSCKNDEIPCTNGQCVLIDNFCDGKFDCLDRSDEPDGCQI